MTGTNDFALVWNIQTRTPALFVYTTSGNTNTAFQTSQFSKFDVTTPSVPEPASLWMMVFGAVLMGLVIRPRG